MTEKPKKCFSCQDIFGDDSEVYLHDLDGLCICDNCYEMYDFYVDSKKTKASFNSIGVQRRLKLSGNKISEDAYILGDWSHSKEGK